MSQLSKTLSEQWDAVTQRFEKKIDTALTRKGPLQKTGTRSDEGRTRGRENSRAAKLFDVKVTKTDKNAARIEWSKVELARDWATLSAGCNLLRTNVADWSDEELWKACIQ